MGTIADLLNAGVSAARGDWGAAATNAFAAFPGFGDGAKAGNMAAKAAAHGNEAAQAVKGALGAVGKGADDAAGAAFAGTRKAGASVAPKGTAFDLSIARGTKQQMLDAVRKLDAADAATKLSADDISGLTENARLVAKKYWELKGTARTAQSVQNQLNRPRWRFLDQAPEASRIIQEIIDDFGG
ncbi:MAG: hypothetical protein KF847_17105 [Pirellulales bacterium]|nr:hypothetical protein [Pirellulales bacterium]